jgi:hypothetical protein
MLPGTARDDDPAPTGCELVRQRGGALLEEYGALMAAVAADPEFPDRARRMISLSADIRALRAALAGHVLGDELLDAHGRRQYQRGRADERAAAVPVQRRARHASSPRAAVLLNVVKVILPPAAIGLAARIWAAHRIAVPVTSAALAASVVTYAAVPSMQHAPYYTPAAKAPAAAAYSAPPAVPAEVVLSPAVKRGHHRKGARHVTVAALPSASASPSPSPAATVPAGTLDVAQAEVVLRPGSPGELSGQVDLYAAGGPVTWSASVPGLSLDSWGGTLASGGVQVVTVTMPSGMPPGTATLTLEPGDETVQVSWGASAG